MDGFECTIPSFDGTLRGLFLLPIFQLQMEKSKIQELLEKTQPYSNELFAENIVRECIRVIYREERTPAPFIMPKQAISYEYSILKHFNLEI